MSKRFLLAVTGCFLVPFLLAGCNGGEDFSDADIGGPIIQPSPGSGSPLPGDVESVEIEFVDDRVLGLGYECRGTDERGTGYTGYVVNDETNQFDDEFEGAPVPEVVECGTEATAVDFFLGNAEGSKRFALGTVYLPQQGKQKRYQIAPTDIITSPARLEVDEQTHDTGTDEQKRAFYMAALLQGLDSDDAPNDRPIDIPYAAHEMIMSREAEPTPRPVQEFSGYEDYPAFKNEWEAWFDDVNSTVALPVDEKTARTRLNQSLKRLRAGTYTVGGTLYEREVVELDDADDIDQFLAPLLIQVPILVYPDGAVQGVGYVARVTGSFDDPERSNTTLGAIVDNGQLTTRLQLAGAGEHDGWEMAGVFGEIVDLEFTGRFLGSNLYYDLDGPLTQSSDYRADFSQSGVYDPVQDDRGFYRGGAFNETVREDGELLTGYKTGFVAADYDEDKLPSGSDPDKAPAFYQLTPYKACSADDRFGADTCENFDDKGVPEPGNNYDFENGTVTDDDGNNSHEVSKEQPKPLPDEEVPAGERSFNVQIRDDGYVFTDLDRNCESISYDSTDGEYKDDDSGITEYRVGFVTRTDDGGDGLDPSMNLIIHMTGPGLSDELPHYGLRTSGRINLSAVEKPFYRTGDDNFDDGIRARWVDQAGPSGFAYEVFRRNIDSDLQSFQERESQTRLRGALEGVALEQSSCSPTTP